MKPSTLLFVVLVAVMLACLGLHCADDSRGGSHNQPILELVRYETPRSSCWERTKREWLVDHPRCEFNGCQSRGPFEVHHVLSFHEHPEHECDPGNLITLCRGETNHHLWVGHQGNFRETNPDVRRDCRRGTLPWKGEERRRAHRKELHRKESR